MSAIAGILHFGGAPVQPGCIQRVTQAMGAQGPDGIHHWQEDGIALGHCTLRTTAEQAGETQPLRDGRSGIVLVLDGRIDNGPELKRELSRRSPAPSGCTDATLVLAAYDAWGVQAPRRLLGDFAFAIWDGARRRLFCAVDQVGACPLFYVHTRNFFAFASTEEALLRIPGVSAAPNEEMVAHMFVRELLPPHPGAAWLRDVKSLLPGHSLEITGNGACKHESYWQFQPGTPTRFDSEDDAQAAFLEVFGHAVRDRLRTDGAVAQMLSGGLDSASVHATARNFAPPARYRSYSAVADDAQSCPETRCIERISRGSRASFVSVPSFTGMATRQDLYREGWSGAHPCDNSILLPAIMCLAARRGGERVMLHGVCGDATLAVPERYPATLMRAGAWRSAWTECTDASVNNTFMRGAAPHSLFLKNAWTAFVPGAAKTFVHRLKSSARLAASCGLDADFCQRVRLFERLERQARNDANSRLRRSSAQESHVQALRGPYGPALGLDGFARLGKRFGLDMRDPWADRRVIQFFIDLPLRFKIRRGWTKYLVRRSLAATMDDEVVWRVGKEHLGWQFTRRLTLDSAALLRILIEQDFAPVAGIIDVRHARVRVQRYLESSRFDADSSPQDARFVYDLLVLAQWLKRLSNAGKMLPVCRAQESIPMYQ